MIFDFSGILYSLTESYNLVFYLSSALFLFGGIVMSLTVLKYHKNPNPERLYLTQTTTTSNIETQTFDEDYVEVS